MSSRVLEIVLTGGPCSGKTAFLPRAEQEARSRGFKVYAIEEPATKLIREKGLRIKEAITTGNLPLTYECEKEITQLCLRVRERIRKEAKITDCWPVIFWDRAIPDNRAYMPEGKIGDRMYARILREEGYHPEEVLAMYQGIIKLTTTADGAPSFYTLENNQARTESLKEAILLDRRIERAYADHPHLFVIDNSTGFEEKMERALVAIRLILNRR